MTQNDTRERTHVVPSEKNQRCTDCGRFRPNLNEGDTCRICSVKQAVADSDESDGNCPDCGGFWDNEECGNCGYEA